MEIPSMIAPQEQKRNAVFAFANQKGGVGKTTLCTLFANFLTGRGYPVLVVDGDGQQSIYHKRQVDLKEHPGASIYYNVQPFDLSKIEFGQQLIEGSRNVKGTVLIDTPGSLSQSGITPILTQADYIVCPFQFDKATNLSTADFIMYVDTICKRYNMPRPQFIFVPNRFIKGWGKSQELDAWAKTELLLKDIGIVTPRVLGGAEITRYNTLLNTPKQDEMTKDCFETIFNTAKDSLVGKAV